MNLQLHLLSRIAGIAMACLLAVSAYALFHSHGQAMQAAWRIADSQGKLLESQLLLHKAGIGLATPFPDFEFWKQSGGQAGVCLSYSGAERPLARSLCTGLKPDPADWPEFFDSGYRWLFNPGRPVVRPIAWQGQIHGSLTVTPSAELEIAEAWNKTLTLTALSGVTLFAVCLLVCLSLRRALRPAKTIVEGIAAMESGRLDLRLPAFELNEWQRIATAINQLAASQQQLLAERRQLVTKLITLREAERRYMTRELHDEFGQCLAAIQAVTACVRQTAARECPQLLSEIDHIGRIGAHMMDSVRQLLGRLRPAEFDELGLAASLAGLVAGWNGRSRGKTRFQLHIGGDCALLSDEQAINLFRITQECLTNIARHADASAARIELSVGADAARLTVSDNGKADRLPFADSGGIGLSGMRERVAALNGQLELAIGEPRGLIVAIQLPVGVTGMRA
ncbi:histidine kinase [Methylomonas sp. SURF-2]|uniref:Histidine kinase n=1 Tax=Methylomonas subterranea TaxID=2952225 RepID=A0ABT1TBG1_9GAMM|nr:histidine kinase [Methylomonas sp. SURF-2]MCQ8102800.1 histidine kinase [Methylomonas sp. SURF-2]